MNIPIKTGSFIEMLKDDNYEKTDIKAYQRFIEKLIYLLYNTRPNIAFVMKQLSKQNANLKVGHLKAAKQILRYFKETIYLEIFYRAGKSKPLLYELTEYANSNYAGIQRIASL